MKGIYRTGGGRKKFVGEKFDVEEGERSSPVIAQKAMDEGRNAITAARIRVSGRSGKIGL
jgi:hypothetical protein